MQPPSTVMLLSTVLNSTRVPGQEELRERFRYMGYELEFRNMDNLIIAYNEQTNTTIRMTKRNGWTIRGDSITYKIDPILQVGMAMVLRYLEEYGKHE